MVALADKMRHAARLLRDRPDADRVARSLRAAARAQGVVKILVEGSLRLKLSDLIGDNAQLREFLLDRVKYYFRDVRGFKYDEVNAVLTSERTILWMWKRVCRRFSRCVRRRTSNRWLPASSGSRTSCGRRNSPAQAAIDAGVLEAGAGAGSASASFCAHRDVVFSHRKARNYKAALEAIASLRPKVDLFFDKVLVNAPEERVRQNRLLLLSSLLTEFSAIADFSEIVTTN